MWTDVADLRDFYAGPLGGVARRLIARQIGELWPDVSGERLAGVGFAAPFLANYIDSAERLLAFMPARQGVINWPAQGPSVSALVEEDDLPLTDAAVERIMLVHCLENADFPAAVLKEAWRVLAPGGRLIAVAPNRRGLWARVDNSPFGHGRPFSRSQLTLLLKETGFSPANWREALFVPPLERFGLLRAAAAFERAGNILPLMFGGVLIVEAQKQFLTARPIRALERVRRTLPGLAEPAVARRQTLAGGGRTHYT
ncbi:MAG: methyltransferase domain-containing protein [Rhodobiaceae bacterium]|nr:methyltransferase domain-containing protein [Rhodobiaceae bacterium]MCC0042618.1 methyltransferase domain-containing protein [Rhodobiaceae bacterium]